MRASAGSAGTHDGRTTASTTIAPTYTPTSAKAGMNDALYMSPTLWPSWSAMMIRTREGGMICASVPDAVMTPAASGRL